MRRRVIRDRGASMIEYAGLIVLAAIILATLTSVLPGTVSDGVSHSVCQIFQGQNCGPAPSSGRPSAQQPARTNDNVPSRFANGFFGGLGNAFGTSRASLPVAPPNQNSGGNNGGGWTVDHNVVVNDTKSLIEQQMGQYVDDGRVTIDCGPGGHAANCIPGAAKNGKGGNGYADIILSGKDKATGKPVIYIWEVKSSGQRGEAPGQLNRYIVKKRAEYGGRVQVNRGFALPTRSGIPSQGGRTLRAWSARGDPSMGGVRLYAAERPRNKTQPQEQPQEDPYGHPATDCNGRPIVASIGCVQPIDPGRPVAPGTRLPRIPAIRIPGIRIPIPLVPAYP